MDQVVADAPTHVKQSRHAVVKYIFNLICYSIFFEHALSVNLFRCCQCHRRLAKQ